MKFGKKPWDIDRLVSLKIISKNTVEQDLIRDVWMKFIEDDSAGLTVGNVSSGIPVNGRSDKLVGWRKRWDFAINDILIVRILVMKKFEKVMHRVRFSASVLVKSQSEEWRSSFVTLHCHLESVQSLSRQWKYTRRDSLMSLFMRRQAWR